MKEHKFRINYLFGLNTSNVNALAHVFNLISKAGLIERVFYDGKIRREDAFIAEMLAPGTLPFLITDGDTVAAFSWLNDITSRMARTHFVILPEYWGKDTHKEIGSQLYGYILNCKDAGGYLFDCLYGIIPKSNLLAIKAALNCGWQKCGEIPKACYLAREGKSIAGILVYTTRAELRN